MSSPSSLPTNFRVIEHVIPCSYIRDYPNATQSQRDDLNLRLAVKQYIPVAPIPKDQPNAITIISAHATGLPKEVYEPLWDDLQAHLSVHGVYIRGIWIADMANHGASGVLNEELNGDDPGWHELSRDLLHMINTFRRSMPRPIFGVAHSAGGTQLMHLSLLHPRLFAGLALIEPMFQNDIPPGPVFAAGTTSRRDIWPTRVEAEEAMRKGRMTRGFDQRVLQRIFRYGLRPVPTAVYPGVGPEGPIPKASVTLTTSKHQEAWTLLRSNFTESTFDPKTKIVSARDRLLAPDVNHETSAQYLFFRPEFGLAFSQLPFLRPRVLYLFGERSMMSTPALQAGKVDATGIGVGGGGGVQAGQVTAVTIPGAGHMTPCENVTDCAHAVGDWLIGALTQWKDDEELLRTHDAERSETGKLKVSSKWIEMVKIGSGKAKRPSSRMEKL